MKTLNLVRGGIAFASALFISTAAQSQIIWSENFDVDHTANWTVNLSHSDASANAYFDYSTVGVPSAPGAGGSTRGLRFLCNQSAATLQGISASPTGFGITGDFVLRFNMWLNYNGPLGPTGTLGNGSTQVGTFGIGTTGVSPNYSSVNNGILFGTSTDGGSTQDYRVYTNGALVSPLSSPGVYGAGNTTSPDSRNNTDPYYISLGGKSAPAGQLSLYPGQTGTTPVGSSGFAWRSVSISNVNGSVTYTLDGLRIATVSSSAITSTNISFGLFDVNGLSSSDVNDHLIFSLFDNITIETVPEPSSLALLAISAVACGYHFGRRKV